MRVQFTQCICDHCAKKSEPMLGFGLPTDWIEIFVGSDRKDVCSLECAIAELGAKAASSPILRIEVSTVETGLRYDD